MSDVEKSDTIQPDLEALPPREQISFDEQYRRLVWRIMTEGVREVNTRTEHEIRALPGETLEVEDVGDAFPLLSLRKMQIPGIVAETVWALSGSRRVEDLRELGARFWDPFANPNGVIPVAYGFRWRRHFGRDQLTNLISTLEKDPSSRQAVVFAWDPGSDGLGNVPARKNIPCPLGFAVNIIGGKLHMHCYVRSNDVMLGLPTDVADFALLQCMLAQRLGVKPGKYTHSISNAHIYDIHYDAARELVRRPEALPAIPIILPEHSLSRAMQGDSSVVPELLEAFGPYQSHPPIKGLKIVL